MRFSRKGIGGSNPLVSARELGRQIGSYEELR